MEFYSTVCELSINVPQQWVLCMWFTNLARMASILPVECFQSGHCVFDSVCPGCSKPDSSVVKAYIANFLQPRRHVGSGAFGHFA